MPQSVTPRRCFYTKQRNPSPPSSSTSSPSIFPLSSLPFSARSRAGDPTLPFPFHLPSIAQLRLSPARKYGGERGRLRAGVVAKRSLSRWPPPRNRHSRKCINLISSNSIRVLLHFLMAWHLPAAFLR